MQSILACLFVALSGLFFKDSTLTVHPVFSVAAASHHNSYRVLFVSPASIYKSTHCMSDSLNSVFFSLLLKCL